MTFHFDITSEEQTRQLGDALALFLRAGDVLALQGDLGAGKSTLARHILRAFADDEALEVPSPTYTLIQDYSGAKFRFPILHADLYRLKDDSELDELDLFSRLDSHALLIEWPEKASNLPQSLVHVHLELKVTLAQRASLHIMRTWLYA